MSKLRGNRTLTGTWGEIWVDGELIAELSKIEVKVSANREDVQLDMDVDSKMTGIKGEFTLTIKKAYTRYNQVLESWKKGVDLRSQIITKLHEHDRFFTHRKAFQNCHQIVSGIEIGGFDVLIVLRQPIDPFRLRWTAFFFQKFPSAPPGRTHINHGMIFLCL